MNTDYRISVGFFRHHKTRKLQKRLGSDGVLALLKLWGYATEFRSDGDLSGMPTEDIELAIDWMKETPLIATLVEIGFIDGQEGSYCLHEWQEHNPWAAKDGSRSDKARFSRVAKTHPETYKEMREKGINEISAIDYEKLTNTTKKQRTLNDSLENANGSLTNRSESPTPAPAPAPAPIPAPKEEKTVSQNISAQAPDTHTAPPSAPRVEPTPATTEPAATEPTATALPEPTAPAKPARQAKVAKAVKVAAEPLPDAPEWIPTDLWQAFIAHRQAKGKDKALTASSATLTLKQLEKAKGFGHDPVALVESAIANGWTGCVFDKHLKPAPTTPTAATPLNGQRYPSNDPHEKHGRLVTGNNSAIEQWLNRDNPASPFTVTVIPTPVLEITHANH